MTKIKQSKKVTQILEICEDYSLEIVSYGLAPNPNGFCFEIDPDNKPSKKILKQFDSLLNELTDNEVNKLRAIIFYL